MVAINQKNNLFKIISTTIYIQLIRKEYKELLKYTRIVLENIKNQELLLTLEKDVRRGNSGEGGVRYIESDEHKNIIHEDANNSNGRSMTQILPSKGIEFKKNVKLEVFLNTPDDSDFGYFVHVELKKSDE